MLDPEVVQYRFVVVLCCQTCVSQVPWNVWPFPETAVVEHHQVVRDDERYDSVIEALFEHDKPSYASIAVLKRMYGLEALMEVEYVLKFNVALCLILF